MRAGKSLPGIARALREVGEGESWAHEAVSLVAGGAGPPSVEEGRAQARKVALETLAERHGITATKRTTGGEDLLDALEEPEKLGEWCAVTISPESGNCFLYPAFDSAAGRCYDRPKRQARCPLRGGARGGAAARERGDP